MFEAGTKVVHKTHGVGTIHGIETQNYGAGPQDYYLMKIDASGLVVRFPCAAESTAIRKLVNDRQIAGVYDILASPPKNYSMVWNRRKKEFLEKIGSGSLNEIAEVYRDLSRLKESKELSFGEKEMLEKARVRLINEISAAKELTRSEVENLLDKALT